MKEKNETGTIGTLISYFFVVVVSVEQIDLVIHFSSRIITSFRWEITGAELTSQGS
jgi:hypothetical protein